jgi:hypothetical protein
VFLIAADFFHPLKCKLIGEVTCAATVYLYKHLQICC